MLVVFQDLFPKIGSVSRNKKKAKANAFLSSPIFLFPMFSTFWAWKAPELVCLLSTIYRRFHVLQNKLKITPSCQKLSYKRSISSKISINSTPIFRLNADLFAKLEISCVCFESAVQNRFHKWWLLKKAIMNYKYFIKSFF